MLFSFTCALMPQRDPRIAKGIRKAPPCLSKLEFKTDRTHQKGVRLYISDEES